MRASLSEVGAKAVAADIFHLVLIWEGRDSRGGVLFAKGTVEEDKVCKSPPN